MTNCIFLYITYGSKLVGHWCKVSTLFKNIPPNQCRDFPFLKDITIGKDGTPLYQEKFHMKPNGYGSSSGYLMWRYSYGKGHCSKCKNSYKDSNIGEGKPRPEWDIRLYTDVPHSTDAYKRIYGQCTNTERINNGINQSCLLLQNSFRPIIRQAWKLCPFLFFMPSRSLRFHNYPSFIPLISENLPLPVYSLLSFRNRSTKS